MAIIYVDVNNNSKFYANLHDGVLSLFCIGAEDIKFHDVYETGVYIKTSMPLYIKYPESTALSIYIDNENEVCFRKLRIGGTIKPGKAAEFSTDEALEEVQSYNKAVLNKPDACALSSYFAHSLAGLTLGTQYVFRSKILEVVDSKVLKDYLDSNLPTGSGCCYSETFLFCIALLCECKYYEKDEEGFEYNLDEKMLERLLIYPCIASYPDLFDRGKVLESVFLTCGHLLSVAEHDKDDIILQQYMYYHMPDLHTLTGKQTLECYLQQFCERKATDALNLFKVNLLLGCFKVISWLLYDIESVVDLEATVSSLIVKTQEYCEYKED